MIAAIMAAGLSTMWMPSAPPRAPVPDATPALWVVNDEDTIIYLFGTFHALDGKSDWFNDEVKTAFAGADELVLETVVPVASAAAPSETPAPSRLNSVGPIAGSGSFLSTSKMVMSAGRARGMSTAKGADSILRDAAERLGKPVGGLENFGYQLAVFGSMAGTAPPPDPQRAALTKAALAAILAELQAAWNRGDVERFTPMLEQMRTRSPENYRLLFPDRNARWAHWIVHRLQQPGVVFVAVGAGHLAGKDSVQHKLAQVGFRTARIN